MFYLITKIHDGKMNYLLMLVTVIPDGVQTVYHNSNKNLPNCQSNLINLESKQFIDFYNVF